MGNTINTTGAGTGTVTPRSGRASPPSFSNPILQGSTSFSNSSSSLNQKQPPPTGNLIDGNGATSYHLFLIFLTYEYISFTHGYQKYNISYVFFFVEFKN